MRNEKGQFVKGNKEGFQKGNKLWEHPNVVKSRFPKGQISTPKPFVKGQTPWNKGLHYGIGERFRGQIMNLSLYRDWRNRVKERDKYICVLCDDKEGTFNVDHFPKSFAEIIKQNNIINLEQARECPELWDINNARTLCVPCHKTTLTYGGKKIPGDSKRS